MAARLTSIVESRLLAALRIGGLARAPLPPSSHSSFETQTLLCITNRFEAALRLRGRTEPTAGRAPHARTQLSVTAAAPGGAAAAAAAAAPYDYAAVLTPRVVMAAALPTVEGGGGGVLDGVAERRGGLDGLAERGGEALWPLPGGAADVDGVGAGIGDAVGDGQDSGADGAGGAGDAEGGRSPAAPLSLHGGIKRSVLKKKRRHGFLRRLETTGGRRVLSKRRIKGRKFLTV
jgi:ribosomal protein L34